MTQSRTACVTVVSPVYNSAATLELLVDRVSVHVSAITSAFEFFLVDDGSSDGSWEKILALSLKDPRIRGLRLSRNFGQHAALSAGLAYGRGDIFLLLDSDLQDNPDYIPDLYSKINSGADIVFAKKVIYEQSVFRRLMSTAFYAIASLLGAPSIDPAVGTYSMLRRKVVDAFLECRDYYRGYVYLLAWLGFRTEFVSVHQQPREGKSTYTITRLVRLGFATLLVHTEGMLWFIFGIGGILSCASALALVALFFGYPSSQIPIANHVVLVSIILSLGILLAAQGIVGLYVARVFEQVKGRPRFVVAEDTHESRQSNAFDYANDRNHS